MSLKFFRQIEGKNFLGCSASWSRAKGKSLVRKLRRFQKMNCDKAAEVLVSKQFRKVSEKTFKSVRKRKPEILAKA